MAFVPAPGYQPTYNPTLPYNSPIPGGLSVGMSVYIQGVAKENMNRFAVNFMVGGSPGSDIAFHFNPRFDGWDKVVFNTQQGGQWGQEERKKSMPFSRGSPFELVFMILQEHYKVVVNGNPFYEYRHRLPLQMVTHLHVDGDLQLQSINFLGGQSAPTHVPDGTVMFLPPACAHIRGDCMGGSPPEKTIIIKGFVPPTAKSFAINFKVGSTGELALHINPRLHEGVVVRNSHLNGSWGPEERRLPFNPFGPGQYFDLSIRCGNDRFKVYANGQQLFDYAHRVPAFQRVDMLEIHGDVALSYVQI
uniref:Galectin n=1 Tax=Cavia porcellus TaxID=10141 RepID=H0VZ70_CAVPO